MQGVIVQASTLVQVDIERARQWFLDLETHPERYRFDSHAGFAFREGGFGEVGARFETWETFCGLRLNLRFELTAVEHASFRFRLTRPQLPVWGAFVLCRAVGSTTDLCLEIGATRPAGAWFLKLRPIRHAVRRQIRGEVEHIRASMEAVCGGERDSNHARL